MIENILEKSLLFRDIAKCDIESMLTCLSASRKEYKKDENIVWERSVCPHHSTLIGNLLDGIAEKALVLHDRNDCLIKPTIRDKVLTFLLRLALGAQSRSFTIPMRRDAMAEYLNVDRSALSRELSWMKRDGLINFKNNWFELRDYWL